MTKEIEFEIESELSGDLLYVISIKVGGINYSREYINSLDLRAQKKVIARIKKIACDYGLSLHNAQIFKWLKGYEGIGEIKTRNPSHRILITNYEYSSNFLILLSGFPKKTEKADKRIKTEYDKADKIRKLILENRYELHKKLDRIIETI